MKVYSHSLQGKRESNEDQHYNYFNLNGSDKEKNDINFLSVYDGHGGKLVSKYLKDNLPIYFIKKFKRNIYLTQDTFSKYVNSVYNLLQDNLKSEHPRAVNYCGSTSCIIIHCINHEEKKSFLWIINVGDSRGVLSNKDSIAIPLSKDHKPNSPEEKMRIEKLGGEIVYDGVDWRVKDLSLSRAFGDVECTPYVTHLPQIYCRKLSKGDKFLILACDGLWDVLSNQDAVDIIIKLETKNYKGNYAKFLAEYALEKGSLDNITVIVYYFE
jgi:serine/threonine protein phosphatase PrpC